MADEQAVVVDDLAVWLAEALVRRADGHRLVSVDDPMRRMLGWTDMMTGERYEIGLTDTKRTVGRLSDRVRELIVTPFGRDHLLLAGRDEGATQEERQMPITVVTETTPSVLASRPLGVAPFADAFAAVEEQGQRVERVELHPDDLVEALSGGGLPLDEGVRGELGANLLWGALLLPTMERTAGEIVVVGEPEGSDPPKVVVIRVAE